MWAEIQMFHIEQSEMSWARLEKREKKKNQWSSGCGERDGIPNGICEWGTAAAKWPRGKELQLMRCVRVCAWSDGGITMLSNSTALSAATWNGTATDVKHHFTTSKWDRLWFFSAPLSCMDEGFVHHNTSAAVLPAKCNNKSDHRLSGN